MTQPSSCLDAPNPTLKAFVAIFFDIAKRGAAKLGEQRAARSLLAGQPLARKDLRDAKDALTNRRRSIPEYCIYKGPLCPCFKVLSCDPTVILLSPRREDRNGDNAMNGQGRTLAERSVEEMRHRRVKIVDKSFPHYRSKHLFSGLADLLAAGFDAIVDKLVQAVWREANWGGLS